MVRYDQLELLKGGVQVPFVLPTFNVLCNVFHTLVLNPVPPPLVGLSFQVRANFSLGKRTLVGADITETLNVQAGVGIDAMLRIMMVAAGTDLRGTFQGQNDIVEVPAGSGAYYLVVDVADMAKGFSNEHRVAWCLPREPSLGYTLPIPLP